MNKYIWTIRGILWSMLLLFILFLLNKTIVPGGYLSATKDFAQKFSWGQGLIAKLSPADRVQIDAGVLKILGDPVYFSVSTPRKFNRARLTVKYRNNFPIQYPLLEAGVLMDKVVWSYKLAPLSNQLLDNLDSNWKKIKNNNLSLWQKEENFKSIEDFLASNPRRQEVALYNYNLSAPYILSDYQATQEVLKLPRLRGPYQIYTYIKNEDLKFDFNFSDLGENQQADWAFVSVYDYTGQTIFSQELQSLGAWQLKLSGLPEGVYKIALRVSDDVLTQKLETTQNRVVFLNKVWLLDEANLWTDQPRLAVRTINPASLGTVSLATQTFTVDAPYKLFDFSVSNQDTHNYELKSSSTDLILENAGVFGLSSKSLFNPEFLKINKYLDLAKLNYLLADYQAPVKSGDYSVATAEFDINNAYLENGRHSFMLSVPGLKTDDSLADYLEIKEIKIEFYGKSLLTKLQELVKKIYE